MTEFLHHFFGPDPLNLLGVIILTSLGTWGLPQMVGKFYAIKSEKSIKTGMIVSTAFAVVVSGGCYFLGGFEDYSLIKLILQPVDMIQLSLQCFQHFLIY